MRVEPAPQMVGRAEADENEAENRAARQEDPADAAEKRGGAEKAAESPCEQDGHPGAGKNVKQNDRCVEESRCWPGVEVHSAGCEDKNTPTQPAVRARHVGLGHHTRGPERLLSYKNLRIEVFQVLEYGDPD